MTTTDPTSSSRAACAVNRFVPFVHVRDVDASLAFYALLGFAPENSMQDAQGPFWAAARSGSAQIMFARADAAIDPAQQAVIFYMYGTDVAGLRAHLLRSGVHDGGRYCGAKGPNGGRRVVFEVTHPEHMRGGELRVADPDGYCILVGQTG